MNGFARTNSAPPHVAPGQATAARRQRGRATSGIVTSIRRLAGIATVVLGLVVTPVASGLQALTIYTDNPTGNLSLISPSGPAVSTTPLGLHDVAGLSSVVYARAGDNLEITVTAEITAPSDVLLRALVDSEHATPAGVVFRLTVPGQGPSDGARSFTFVKANVAAGRHVIQIQAAGVYTMGARTLSVNAAAPDWGQGRLAVAGSDQFPISKTSSIWEDIPNLVTTLKTSTTTDLKITFSAEMASGRFFARAVVDGQPVSDVLVANPSSWSLGASSFTFVKKAVRAGTHTVKMQWSAETPIQLYRRTLTAFASPASLAGGGLVATAIESAPIALSSNWADVPGMSGSFVARDPSTNVQIGFSAEGMSTGPLLLRALIDGQPAQPGEAALVTQGGAWRAQSFAFIEKNVLPGTHTVKIQARLAPGATGQLADRSLSILFKRRHGVDFAHSYASLAPRAGSFPMLVICFDPLRPGEVRPTRAQVVSQFRGDDGGVSLQGWFDENTGGSYVPHPITFLGCEDNNWFVAPPGRQGTWYWDNKAWGLMFEDAIQAADPFFDFHQYDDNRDGTITGDELTVVILRPQNGTDGFRRDVSGAVDGISTPLRIDILDVYFDANNGNRRLNVGIMAHEASHLVLGAADMYYDALRGAPCPPGFDTRPYLYTVMDDHGGANHLDPFHKLKSGYLAPDVVETNKWATRTVSVAAVETQSEAVIIYDPAKDDREYFIIENRWGGTPADPTHDSNLPGLGLAVWHIVEDVDLANQFRPGGTGWCIQPGDWAHLSVRFLGTLSSTGASKELHWADGTRAKIKLTAKTGPAEVVRVEVKKLP